MMRGKLLLTLIALTISSFLYSQVGRTYSDGHGGRIFFPFGDISFADEVVSFKVGNPAPIEGYGPQNSLGIPDYTGDYEKKYTTLGYGGELIVKFTDNVLYDIEGPDLFILEIGPDIEPVDVFISKKGNDWISVGRTGGGLSAIDIAGYAKKTDIFRYVKIIDVKERNSGRWPGADIDAIGAIGSSINFQISSAVLFESGKATLGSDKSDLYEIADKIKEIKGLTNIEGHTDNVGSSESNLKLSDDRAKAIKNFFTDSCNVDSEMIEIHALGENSPVADNNTEEGREKNRRVEIIVFPDASPVKDDVVGNWETGKRGKMRIYRYGDVIAGWYESDGGEILGELTDEHTITGKWIENGSAKTCDSYVYDRNNWGNLRIEFNEDFTAFSAKWGYCDEEPVKDDWNGKRK
ncbi:MAG: OmpA family protein [Bacteroidota bacterium]